MKTKYDLLTLLREFMRFGTFTFGGGWGIIAQMQQVYVEEKKLITEEDLLDTISVAKSLPGVMICNVATLFGYRVAGLGGGLIALLGMSLPPMLVMLVISMCYRAFRENYWVMAAMRGAQAAVVPVIASAALAMVKGSLKNRLCILVTVVCGLLYYFFEVNAVLLVLIGVISGLLISEYYDRKGASEWST